MESESNRATMPCTSASELLRTCDRLSDVGDDGFSVNSDGLTNSGIDGDCGVVVPPYGGREPFTRSGDSGNSGVPGDCGNLNCDESIASTDIN